jgi:hypothetical protein
LSSSDERVKQLRLVLEAVDNWFEALDRYGLGTVKDEIPRLREGIKQAIDLGYRDTTGKDSPL